MSAHHQNASGHYKFEQSEHRQRVLAMPPQDPVEIEYETLHAVKLWHGHRSAATDTHILEGASQSVYRTHYLSGTYTEGETEYTSVYTGNGYAAQGSPSDQFYRNLGSFSGANPWTDVVTPLASAVESLAWTESLSKIHRFDEWSTSSGANPLDTSAINPASYTGDFDPTLSDYSDPYSGDPLPDFDPLPGAALQESNPRYLYSGYQFQQRIADSGWLNKHYSEILARKRRFRHSGADDILYWFGVAQFALAGTYNTYEYIWSPVEVLETGTLSPSTWLEIDVPAGSDMVNIYSEADGEDRLSIGRAVFCILRETPLAWSIRTGIALA